MEIVITAKVKLLPTMDQISMLDDTLTAIRAGLNYASKIAYENNLLSAFKKLQTLTYDVLRSEFGLKSQMACNVCSVVAGTYASMKTNKENTLAIYKKPKLQYSYNRDYSFYKDGQISINTIDKRIRMPFVTKGMEQYFDGTWEYGTAILVKKKGKYFLHITVKKEVEICQDKEITNIVGIDVGMNYIATAVNSSNNMLFIGGRHMKNIKSEYKRTRKSLQQRQTPSARQRLKKIGNRENRWQQDLNHKVAKALVQFAGKNSLIVLEDLTGIRNATEKVKRRNRYYSVSWAFFDLRRKSDNELKLIVISAYELDEWGTTTLPTGKRIRARYIATLRLNGETYFGHKKKRRP